mmetsp:Transcript_10090/g.29918  ORF Transcript_10090/g.29918 Transcript_10090/m.29918 type:complete len:224 (+) Transcript_10090:165-836(+)
MRPRHVASSSISVAHNAVFARSDQRDTHDTHTVSENKSAIATVLPLTAHGARRAPSSATARRRHGVREQRHQQRHQQHECTLSAGQARDTDNEAPRAAERLVQGRAAPNLKHGRTERQAPIRWEVGGAPQRRQLAKGPQDQRPAVRARRDTVRWTDGTRPASVAADAAHGVVDVQVNALRRRELLLVPRRCELRCRVALRRPPGRLAGAHPQAVPTAAAAAIG